MRHLLTAAGASLALTAALAPALAAGAAATPDGPDAAARPQVVEGWPTTTPVAAGFSPYRLGRLAEEARADGSSCLAVLRDGKLVRQWAWDVPRKQPREVFSITKSVASALVGIAVRDGDLRASDPVSDYVPAWRGTPSEQVTVRNLLSNDSGRFWSMASDYDLLLHAENRTAYAVGLDQQHAPGSAWAYNNAAIQVLDRVISRATGTPTDQYAAERLFGPLGMTHTRMTRDASGRSTNVFASVQSTCLDLARFTQLYQRDGRVGGERLLSRSWVRSSVGRSSTDLNAAYGYLWWVNRFGVQRGPTDPVDADGQPLDVRTGRLVPGAPSRLFSALGFGGQVAMVDPASRTMVVRLGPGNRHDYSLADAARVVTWALTSPARPAGGAAGSPRR